MKFKYLSFLIVILFIVINFTVQAQDSSSIKNEAILIAIEDSLRGKLIWENDSAWLNTQLAFQSEVNNIKNIKYKLVKISKKDFYEGPFPKLNYSVDSLSIQNSTFGQDSFSILGYKFYTYIGNSSWGYYLQYQFERVYSTQILDIEDLKPFIPYPTCKHGWNQLRGQACYQCLNEYRQKEKNNSK